jgi:ribosomal protein S18 acetylase RimI-like enzyme
MVTTRPATINDEADALRLLSQLFERDITADPRRSAAYRRMLDNERGTVLVAEDETGILGVISFSFNLAIRYDGGYAQIEELVVDEAARGKHVGAALVRAAIDEARRRGCDEMGLYPREHNRPFYEKLGFQYVGVELRQRLA